MAHDDFRSDETNYTQFNGYAYWGDLKSRGQEKAVLAEAPDDPIHRPNHYARYAIEPITFIMANNLPFCVGNVVKYVLRYDAKNGREDLMKARRYIDMILENMDRAEKGTTADCVGKPL